MSTQSSLNRSKVLRIEFSSFDSNNWNYSVFGNIFLILLLLSLKSWLVFSCMFTDSDDILMTTLEHV